MRNVIVIAGSALCLLLSSAKADNIGIPGSKHDFSGRSWMPDGQICVICHTPHNAAAPSGAGLLWNHRQTVAQFLPYTSATLKAAVGQPDGSARLCLNCHDGTVMLDAFENRAGSELCGRIIGTDLRRVHPLSFVYDDALAVAAGHLKSPSITPSGFGGTISSDLLRGGKMQCSSCHEPHARYSNGKLLRKNDRNGTAGLCGICHTSRPPGSIDMGRWD